MLLYTCNPAQFLDQIHVTYMWFVEQEHYFEETIKMRNLLQEFRTFHGIRKPTILGVREHVFTGSVSSLAWFMSAQETVFVTLSQRVLANPLKIRMHYGHPDVFDRLWFISRGGISKASRTINISEDIFAGFNCTLRGGTVTHHEYIQVNLPSCLCFLSLEKYSITRNYMAGMLLPFNLGWRLCNECNFAYYR